MEDPTYNCKTWLNSPHPISMADLFVYGTLLVPEIWQRVSGESDGRFRDATLPGYRIARVRDADFPAIAHTGNETDLVPGRIHLDVPPEAMRRLDAYEDSFYERAEVEVLCGETLQLADTYRIPRGLEEQVLSSNPWTLEWFVESALPDYWIRVFGEEWNG